MKTFRRDKLRRLIEAGKIVVVGSYHFDDMYGSSRDTAKDMPAALDPGDWQLRKPGVCYLFASDFTSHGRCWQNEDGTITLIVHSNSNYTFRVVS